MTIFKRINPLSHRCGILLLWLAVGLLTACTTSTTGTAEEDIPMTLELTSPAFSEGQPIPRQYSCDGADISPPLAWRNVPDDAASLALIMDDPDAPRGDWVHWVIYNLPPALSSLPADVPRQATLDNGGVQGANSWNRSGYGGPCPPRGVHRYFFKLYALDTLLDLGPGATKAQLLQAMQGRILAEGRLMGTYQR